MQQGFEATGPRQLLKQAFTFGPIQTPEEADVWHAMLEDRNPITHPYLETLAEAIAANIRAHYAARLVDMAGLVAALSLDQAHAATASKRPKRSKSLRGGSRKFAKPGCLAHVPPEKPGAPPTSTLPSKRPT
jgi:hypothetical protein